MELDRFSFLRPWTLMLPDRGAAVVLAVGSGGKSTLLRRLHDHYRENGRRVVWGSLMAHPAPVGLPAAGALQEAKSRLLERGSVYLEAALPPESVDAIREELQPDVLLLEGGERGEGRLQPEPPAYTLPSTLHQLFCVGPLHAVGKPWSSRHVVGAPEEAPRDGAELRRVRTEDVLDGVRSLGREDLPAGALAVPFLTGFGEFRDVDGMFSLVAELCDMPAARAVCLAELLGNERRDTADLATLPEGSPAATFLDGERVYAVYPSELDD